MVWTYYDVSSDIFAYGSFGNLDVLNSIVLNHNEILFKQCRTGKFIIFQIGNVLVD